MADSVGELGWRIESDRTTDQATDRPSDQATKRPTCAVIVAATCVQGELPYRRKSFQTVAERRFASRFYLLESTHPADAVRYIPRPVRFRVVTFARLLLRSTDSRASVQLEIAICGEDCVPVIIHAAWHYLTFGYVDSSN